MKSLFKNNLAFFSKGDLKKEKETENINRKAIPGSILIPLV
jgi:hypothetical protein